MEYESINLQDKLSKFQDKWAPKVIAEMNDYQFKVVKVQGDFVWHKHEDTDEVFLVIEGEITIHFRDGKVVLKEGEMFVVPKDTEHKPYARHEAKIMLIEPKGVVNTGNSKNVQSAENDVWI